MKKGILQSILFFGIGFGLAGISLTVIGNPYIHALGVHHVILFLTVIIGVVWTLSSLALYFFKGKTQKLIGIIIMNSIIILCSFLYVAIPLYSDSNTNTYIESNFIRTEINGDTVKIYHSDNLVYIKVKDSVQLDLR